ncbi:MAG TPA: hypothetical protein VLG37_02980 [Candidatus Saccharimonadales bacterium]|nr:hypothetical protein [Candidatus Saccharimonadales bacterium]
MERLTIEATVAGIPFSALGKVARDHEIWEGTDGGAQFKVTRHQLAEVPGVPEILSLSVSGEPSERDRIISEFEHVFGKAAIKDPPPEGVQYIQMVGWLFRRKI